MSEAIVRFEDVHKWYGNVSALKGISVEIGPGLIGLLGPNGAGKTTLLRLLTGMIRPSRGRVQVLGQPVWNNPSLYGRVGYSPEADVFWDFLTGREFLEKLLQVHRFDRKQSRQLAEEALAEVDLLEGGEGDRRIVTYSRGMRQRLRIAQAIAHRPDILFLDEPLSGTDPIQRRRLKNLIRRFGQEGKTVILSSHVLHEVEAVTREFLLVHKGKVVAQGDVHEIRGLIDAHPHTIVLSTDRPRDLARSFYSSDLVSALEFEPKALRVRTTRPDDFYSRLSGWILESGVAVEEIYSPDDNLESVFRYLVE